METTVAGHDASEPKTSRVPEWLAAATRRLEIDRRLAPAAACLSDTPDDCWIVEWVALKPEARGKGVAAKLLERVLQRGRDEGFKRAQISYLIGNTPAQRCYEQAGFRTVDDKRDASFEAIFGRPGTERMLREL